MLTPDDPPKSSRLWPRLALAALLVLAFVGFYLFGLHEHLGWDSIRGNLDSWQQAVRDNLALAVLIFFVVYVLVTALSLPAAGILSLLAGALFGRWLGAGVASTAATVGATLAFLSSRYVLREWVQRRFAGRLEPINRGVVEDGAYYLFMMRLIPAVPFFLINLAMGLTPMRVGTFVAVSWIGMLPGSFLFANAGTELATLQSPAGLLSWRVLGSLALIGVAPLLIRQALRWLGARGA
jgi:uncharacterized membrane protein YdjX (TVP38/TMEM64 family)